MAPLCRLTRARLARIQIPAQATRRDIDYVVVHATAVCIIVASMVDVPLVCTWVGLIVPLRERTARASAQARGRHDGPHETGE